MRKIQTSGSNFGSWIGRVFPSLFDLFVIAFIITLAVIDIPRYDLSLVKGVTLVFGSIGLMLASFCLKQEREYNSIFLAMLALWSLAMVFVHSFYVGSASWQWLNWCVMNEGFIYILYSTALVYTIVRFGKNFRWYYPALLYAIGAEYKLMFDEWLGWSMTPLMAFGIAVIILSFIKKKRWIFWPTFLGSVGVALYKLDWLVYKFKLRPFTWTMSIQDIKTTWLFGRGFDRGINERFGWIYTGTQDGWAYINNDLLELGRNLGVPAMLFIALFFIKLLLRSRVSLAYVLLLTVAIMSMFQRTLHFYVKGGITCIIIAMTILENWYGRALAKAKNFEYTPGWFIQG